MRLEDAVSYFLREWPTDGYRRPSTDTVRTYGWQLKGLVLFAAGQGKDALSDLTPELLKAAMAAKQTRGPDHPPTHKGGEAAANSLACAARRMARWLLAKGVPVPNLEDVKPGRVPERIQPRVRQDEFKAIEAAILRRMVDSSARHARITVPRDLALIYLLADTGLRAAEVLGMTIESVDFTTGSVVVFRGKGSKARALSIADPDEPGGGSTSLRMLAEWIRVRDSVRRAREHESLWITTRGTPLSDAGLRATLAVACQQGGVEGNRPPHTFRRANFTESYQADPRSVNVLAARMGWSDRSHHMINVYTRGADIDFARTTPIPSVSARWRSTDPKVRLLPEMRRPILENGGGPERAGTNRAALPSLGRVDRDCPAGQPARGRRLQG